jgi:hypothetical protein
MNLIKATHPRNLWAQTVYVQPRKEIDPYRDREYFRPLNRAYTGDDTFWSIPSPEPELDDRFWARVKARLNDPTVRSAARRLAGAVLQWEPNPEKILFAAILRAGVPIADWLTRLLPGSEAVSISLFVGPGVDRAALRMIRKSHPDRTLVFVDGWTGRGGVARAVRELDAGPLAVLNDPWGWADFAGSRRDLFCPTACFTGAATLGFSRTFIERPGEIFSAYTFPRRYCRKDLVSAWQSFCPDSPELLDASESDAAEDRAEPFFKKTDLRLHTNEVCRALINADPKTLYFRADAAEVQEHYPLLLALAERRGVPVIYRVGDLDLYRTRAACDLDITR